MMKISDMNRYTYIPKFGFVLKSKIVLLSMLSVLLALVLLTPTSFLTNAGADQVDINKLYSANIQKIPSKKDKMVAYIKSVNYTITDVAAHQLAEAILIHELVHKIPAELQLSLIRHESRFDQYVVSNAGAIGFYQVMPGVHYDKVLDLYSKKAIHTKSLYDIVTNSSVGVLVLRDCLHKKRNDVAKALMCYNGAKQVGKYSIDVIETAKVIKTKIYYS